MITEYYTCKKSEDYIRRYNTRGCFDDRYISIAKSILLDDDPRYDDLSSIKYLGNNICENPPRNAFIFFENGEKRNYLEIEVIIMEYLMGYKEYYVPGKIFFNLRRSNDEMLDHMIPDHIKEMQSKVKLWHGTERAKPRVFVQSALFSAQRLLAGDKSEGMIFKEKIASCVNSTIYYTGYYLDQCCLDVWSELFFRCQSDFSKEYKFKEKDLLKSLGKDTGGSYKDWLRSNIKRLACSYVDISCESKFNDTVYYTGPLLNAEYCDVGGVWMVRFEERIKPYLIDKTGFSISNYVVRKEFKTHHMAKFIYEYILSRKPNENKFTISLNLLRSYAWPNERVKQNKSAFITTVRAAVKKLNKLKSINFTLDLVESADSTDFNLVFFKKIDKPATG